ncbi:hypothetical protein HYDPIDRAFT_66209, partial [Hydnomerulius pinastri MD-312]
EPDPSIFMRSTDPYKAEIVDYILRSIMVGKHLSSEEHQCTQESITSNADIFACMLLEVLKIPGTIHNLNVPPGTKFNAKLNQRLLNPPQKQFMHS